MDRKYLTPPFDMSEYIFGKRFVIGGLDLDLEDKDEEETKEIKTDSLTPVEKR